MTAGREEEARARQGMSQGEAAEDKHMADARAQHEIAGSTVAIESASTADDVSVGWLGEDRHGPAGVSPQP